MTLGTSRLAPVTAVFCGDEEVTSLAPGGEGVTMDNDPCWPGPAKLLLEGPERGVVLVIALVNNWDRSGNAPNRNGRPKRKADRC